MKKLISITLATIVVLLFSISVIAGNGPTKGVYATGLVPSAGGSVAVAGIPSTGGGTGATVRGGTVELILPDAGRAVCKNYVS
jgi:hypothetical protein